MKPPSSLTQHPLLFVRPSQLKQMRDPLRAKWNTARASSEAARGADIKLAELIDFSQMNDVFASYLEVIGLPVAIIDFNGVVLASSHWQRLCTEFHRTNDGTLRRCLESDTSLSRQLEDGKNYAIYRCGNGLTDCASPIVVEGQHIANLFIGQFFLQPPDPDYFEDQCARFGFDRGRYFAALAEVPIVAEQRVPAILAMLVGFANLLAKQSLAEHRARTAYQDVEQLVVERTQALARSEQRLRSIIELSPVPKALRTMDGRISYLNAAFVRSFGYTLDDIPSVDAFWRLAFPDPAYRAVVLDTWQQRLDSARQGPLPFQPTELNVHCKDGQVRTVIAESVAIEDDAGQSDSRLIVFYDVTAQKKIQRQLDQLAYHDLLTGLPNRRLLDDRLRQAIALAKRARRKVGLLFIDLDKFKQVNDQHGHEAGDWLLKEVAARTRTCLRASDTPSRLGGDEFVVLLPDVQDMGDAVNVAEKIRAVLAMPFRMDDGRLLDISSSIGVVLFPDHADDARQLLMLGDAAMYKAKQGGRNAVVACA